MGRDVVALSAEAEHQEHELASSASPPRQMETDHRMNDVDIAEFWKRHRSHVYLQCYRLLRDQAAAEDSTQETLLRVQRHFDKIPQKANEAIAWITRIAKNCCLNEIRNKGRRPEPRAELPEEEAIGGRTSRNELDHSTEKLANRQLVERLIDRMPGKLMNVAWLYHVQEMNQQEVADTLGISRRTVVERLVQFSESSRRLIERLQWSRHVAAD
jgi:RNA polymerase sigma-70 factor (ECF subfamily)